MNTSIYHSRGDVWLFDMGVVSLPRVGDQIIFMDQQFIITAVQHQVSQGPTDHQPKVTGVRLLVTEVPR